ncbi:unnamed protein product [Merluccius merluccius]
MSRLSGKSDQEIRDLLDEYGINHGPVVDSTRALYEKKILEAMGRKEAKPSPDKTYYREEKEKSRLIPLWVQFLVFLVVAVFLYFVFCNMESTHSEPFKGID